MKPWENGAATYSGCATPMVPAGSMNAAMPSAASAMIFSGARKRPTVSSSLPGYMDTASTTAKYTRL
ncbi:hypothetical protein D3C77_594750 [compost metagenome]